jgi:hypothetical protein
MKRLPRLGALPRFGPPPARGPARMSRGRAAELILLRSRSEVQLILGQATPRISTLIGVLKKCLCLGNGGLAARRRPGQPTPEGAEPGRAPYPQVVSRQREDFASAETQLGGASAHPGPGDNSFFVRDTSFPWS